MQEEIAGKPPRVRKLEFLINYYSENLHKYRECSEEWYRELRVLSNLRTEYSVLTGKRYEVKNE